MSSLLRFGFPGRHANGRFPSSSMVFPHQVSDLTPIASQDVRPAAPAVEHARLGHSGPAQNSRARSERVRNESGADFPCAADPLSLISVYQAAGGSPTCFARQLVATCRIASNRVPSRHVAPHRLVAHRIASRRVRSHHVTTRRASIGSIGEQLDQLSGCLNCSP